MKMAVDQPGPSYWDGAAPPSSVLGVGAKVPSSLFGVGSLAALGETNLKLEERHSLPS